MTCVSNKQLSERIVDSYLVAAVVANVFSAKSLSTKDDSQNCLGED